jgi:hypothetical protein
MDTTFSGMVNLLPVSAVVLRSDQKFYKKLDIATTSIR